MSDNSSTSKYPFFRQLQMYVYTTVYNTLVFKIVFICLDFPAFTESGQTAFGTNPYFSTTLTNIPHCPPSSIGLDSKNIIKRSFAFSPFCAKSSKVLIKKKDRSILSQKNKYCWLNSNSSRFRVSTNFWRITFRRANIQHLPEDFWFVTGFTSATYSEKKNINFIVKAIL